MFQDNGQEILVLIWERKCVRVSSSPGYARLSKFVHLKCKTTWRTSRLFCSKLWKEQGKRTVLSFPFQIAVVCAQAKTWQFVNAPCPHSKKNIFPKKGNSKCVPKAMITPRLSPKENFPVSDALQKKYRQKRSEGYWHDFSCCENQLCVFSGKIVLRDLFVACFHA